MGRTSFLDSISRVYPELSLHSLFLTCSEVSPCCPLVTPPPPLGRFLASALTEPDAVVGNLLISGSWLRLRVLFLHPSPCRTCPLYHSASPQSRKRRDKNVTSVCAWAQSNSCQQMHSFHTCLSAWEEQGLGAGAHISWASSLSFLR